MIGQWLRSKFQPEPKPCGAMCGDESHQRLIQETYSNIDSFTTERKKVIEEIEKTERADLAIALLRARDRVVQP